MNLAEQHEQAVTVRVGTRHPLTIEFADGSTRTVYPMVERSSGGDFYPNFVRVRTIPEDQGVDGGGVEIRSQILGEVINLPAIEGLAENEIVFVSGLVIGALEAHGEFGYSGRVVSPGKTRRDENGKLQAVLSWTTTRLG